MADGQIITRAHIRAKARSAFNRGQSRDSHGFNQGAAAIFDWLDEYDRLAAQDKASQQSHAALTRARRVDVRQGVEA